MDWVRFIGVVIVGLTNVGLAMAVYTRSKRTPANRAFAGAVMAIVAWLLFAFLSDQPALSAWALELNRVTLASAVAMGTMLLYFAVLFPNRSASLGHWWTAFFATGALMGLLTAFTGFVVGDVEFEAGSTDVVPGPGFALFVAWMLVGFGLLTWVLVRRLQTSRGRERAQVRLLMLGIVLFTLSSMIFGLILPVITGSYGISAVNTFSTLFLTAFSTYAMVRHRFMDIGQMVLRGVVYMALVVTLGVLLVGAAAVARAGVLLGLDVSADVVFVAAAMIAVFAFQPLLRWLEHLTDRLFFRRTYDPQELLGALGNIMASTLELPSLAEEIACELRTRMRLTTVAIAYTHACKMELVEDGTPSPEPERVIELADRHNGETVYADDPDTDQDLAQCMIDSGVRVIVPLVSDGVALGAVLLGVKLSGEAYSSADARTLEILRAEAAISVKNALLFDEKNRRVRELSALNTLSWALGRDTQFDVVLERALTKVMQITEAEIGSIMLIDPETRVMSIEAAHGLADDVVASTRVRVGEGIAGWVAQHKKPLVLVDAQESGFNEELEREGLRSALCVPLVTKGSVIGVLNVSRKHTGEAFTRENLKIVASFAGQLAVGIDNARLYDDLEKTFLGTIGALAAAVDAKDPYTFGHSSTVTDHTMAIAQELGVQADEIERLRIGALLHDIGKIGIDGSILNKPGELTAAEFEEIRSHPDIAANILGSLDFLQDIVPLVQFHHEHWDGSGYPAGLVGDEIPLGARIISVADAYSAMMSDRPYRAALGHDIAAREIEVNAGTQFDPDVAAAFLRVIARELGEMRPTTRESVKQRRTG